MLQAKIVTGHISIEENSLEDAINQAIKDLKCNSRIIKQVNVNVVDLPQFTMGVATILHEEYDIMDYL